MNDVPIAQFVLSYPNTNPQPIRTHTTHRPVCVEIQVVSYVLAAQQKKADGKVDSLS